MEEIKAEYEGLEQIVQKFGAHADQVQQTLKDVQSRMQTLQETWKGLGSKAFFAEMSDEVLPATLRLQEALSEAARVTTQIAETLHQAEEEAAGLFKGR